VLSTWAGDKHILLEIFNLMLLYFISRYLLATAEVIFSVSGSFISMMSCAPFSVLILDTWISFFAITMSRFGCLVLEEKNPYGWQNIRYVGNHERRNMESDFGIDLL
jgi:hypothetical protein